MVRVSAWGRTGRVRVDRSREGDYNDVYVGPGSKVGNIDKPRSTDARWRVVTWGMEGIRYEAYVESFGAAVMYILQRAGWTPEDRKRIREVWRAERGDVLTVASYEPGQWIVTGPKGIAARRTSWRAALNVASYTKQFLAVAR